MFYNIKEGRKGQKGRKERKRGREVYLIIYIRGGGREDGRGWEEEKRGEGEKWGIWGNFI